MRRTALRQGDLSLYRQVETILRAQIAEGELRAGDRAPTEAALRAQFGVSRATVRQALEALERDGLIERHAGRGTFVRGAGAPAAASMRSALDWRELPRLSLRAARLVRAGTSSAPAHVSAAFGVASSALIPFFIKSANAKPNFGLKRWLHPRFAESIDALAGAANFNVALARLAGGAIKADKVWAEAIMAEPRFAMLLKVAPGSPLLSLWWIEASGRASVAVSQMLQPGEAAALHVEGGS